MRILGIVLMFTVVLFSACKKKERVTDTSAPCMTAKDLDPAFAFEELNKDYFIAFPPGYTYGGYIVYEGDFFIKKGFLATDTISFTAQYGPDAGHKSVYGATLVNTEATKVDIEYRNQIITLKNKKRLCAGETIGYYFYTLDGQDTSSTNKGLGVVYLLDNKDFRQNLIIDFPADKEADVNTIVSTIKKQ